MYVLHEYCPYMMQAPKQVTGKENAGVDCSCDGAAALSAGKKQPSAFS